MIKASELDKNAVNETIKNEVKDWLDRAEHGIIQANAQGKNEFISWDGELKINVRGYDIQERIKEIVEKELNESGYKIEWCWHDCMGYGHAKISW